MSSDNDQRETSNINEPVTRRDMLAGAAMLGVTLSPGFLGFGSEDELGYFDTHKIQNNGETLGIDSSPLNFGDGILAKATPEGGVDVSATGDSALSEWTEQDDGTLSGPSVDTDRQSTKARSINDYSDLWPHFPNAEAFSPITNIKPLSGVEQPVLTGSDVSDHNAPSGVADPFWGRDPSDDRLVIFFEVLDGSNTAIGHGHINNMGTTGVDVEYGSIVVDDDPIHAYPYFNVLNGEIVMTPTNGSEELRVYRGESPETLSYDTTLPISITDLGDPIWFQWPDENDQYRWWIYFWDDGTARVFYSGPISPYDDIAGRDWTEHTAVPANAPKPGGRPRVGQDAVHMFDHTVHEWRIQTLTTGAMEMKQLDHGGIVKGHFNGQWNGQDMHHVDVQPAGPHGDQPLAIVDGHDGAAWSIGAYGQATDQPGSVKLTLGSNQTLPADTSITKINFDTIAHDILNRQQNNGYVAPVSGYHRLSAKLRLDFVGSNTADKRVNLGFVGTDQGELDNGADEYPSTVSESVWTVKTGPARVWLNKDERVTVQVQQMTGGEIDVMSGVTNSWFQVEPALE